MRGGPSEPSRSDDSSSDSTFSTPTETSTETESSDPSDLKITTTNVIDHGE